MTKPATLIQITDTHLFTDPDGRLAGVPTWSSLREIADLIREHHPDFDLMVISGDIAHDEVGSTYEALAREFEAWLPRCRVIPGNHDHPGELARVFGTAGWPLPEGSGFVTTVGEWRVVGLDSHVPGKTSGSVGNTQLEWLADTLAESPDVPTAAFVHHPPVPVGTGWLDEISLLDGAALLEVARDHANLCFIGCGHVHQESEHRVGHALVCSTPSTAFQFSPSGDPKLSPSDAPGYRWLELDGPSLRTGVRRSPALHHPPVSSAAQRDC